MPSAFQAGCGKRLVEVAARLDSGDRAVAKVRGDGPVHVDGDPAAPSRAARAHREDDDVGAARAALDLVAPGHELAEELVREAEDLRAAAHQSLAGEVR